jgi:hypothetical protein
MKKQFIGFYNPTKKQLDKSWSEGVFVFDTSCLLNLYRYSISTKNDFTLVLDKIKDRVFLPHQVGHEFHTNRLHVINEINDSTNAIFKLYKEGIDKVFNQISESFKNHYYYNFKDLDKIKNIFFDQLDKEIKKQKTTHPNYLNKDDILITIERIFENNIGIEYNPSELATIYREGKLRYELSIPPGYKDADSKKKRGDRHVYGDYIIWRQIIDFTKTQKKHIVLVTDDRKDDWWSKSNGDSTRPREELISEFYNLTGIRILIYNSDSFLKYAKERRLADKIKEKSVSEIANIRISEINYLNQLNNQLKSFDINKSFFNSTNNLTSQLQFNPYEKSIGDILYRANPLLESGLSSITSNLNSIASNAFLNTGINTIGNLISERQGIIGKSINVNGSFNPDIENKGIE